MLHSIDYSLTFSCSGSLINVICFQLLTNFRISSIFVIILIESFRVPGNFHIEARSKHHNMNPAMANLSHVVNHFSFGPVLSKAAARRIDDIPNQFFSLESTKPMDNILFVSEKLHQAYHHYIKVSFFLFIDSYLFHYVF